MHNTTAWYRIVIAVGTVLVAVAGRASAQESNARSLSDSITIRIDQTDLASAVQILGQYLDKPVLFIGQSSASVTLDTPRPVPRSDIVRLLRGILDGHGFELVDDTASGLYRARQREVARPTVPQMTAQNSPRAARSPQGEPELFVLPLRHARAVDVAQTINTLYGRGVMINSDPSRAATLGDELRANLLPESGVRTPSPSSGGAGRPGELSGEITIVPDPRANTLLIRAAQSDYELIKSLVEQIDIRPLQVLIEVVIAEVRRDRSLGIGVDGSLNVTPVTGTALDISGGLEGQGLGDFVLKIMGIGGVDADVTLSLAAQRGTVRILSRPTVLATNNQLAEIVVGSQRPFVQLQRSLPTDGAARDQIIQYKEVGTKLSVKPSISDDGSVHLEVTQEVSNATTETAFDAPVISTRSVSTQLLVRDGQTAALGGLTDRQRDVTRRGLPVLSAIPLIGGLFGSSQSRTTETELFVFLTPRVIRNDDDAMRLSAPMQKQAERNRP